MLFVCRTPTALSAQVHPPKQLNVVMSGSLSRPCLDRNQSFDDSRSTSWAILEESQDPFLHFHPSSRGGTTRLHILCTNLRSSIVTQPPCGQVQDNNQPLERGLSKWGTGTDNTSKDPFSRCEIRKEFGIQIEWTITATRTPLTT